MKAVIIALLFVAGAMTQQVQEVDACMTDIQASITLIQKLQGDLATQNIAALLQDIQHAAPLIFKTKMECKDISATDIAGYVYKHLNQTQRDCVTDVLSVVFVAQEVLEELKAQNWTKVIAEVKEVAENVSKASTVCKSAFKPNF